MTTYYITNRSQWRFWQKTNCKSLSAAKRRATSEIRYIDDIVAVGTEEFEGQPSSVATIAERKAGKWTNK